MVENRPNILSPTLRPKKRYIAYQIIAEKNVSFDDFSNAVWHSTLNLLGELGTAETNLWVLQSTHDPAKQRGLIRCSPTAVENVRAALALIQRIGDGRVIVKVLGVSGTVKGARVKFFGETTLKTFE